MSYSEKCEITLLSFLQIAVRSSSIPVSFVYFVNPDSIALIAAELMGAGVRKSGSPAAKLMTSSPFAFIVLARSDKTAVLDSESRLRTGLNSLT